MPTPFLGLSFLISVIIIVINFIIKLFVHIFPKLITNTEFFSKHKSLKIIGSFIIIFVVLSMSLKTYFEIFNAATQEEHSNFSYIDNYIIGCTPIEKEPLKDKLVILRLDDVQATNWNMVSIQMMEDAIARDMPIVAGTIPDKIHEDFRMVSYLKKQSCNIEIAIHGYTHNTNGNVSPALTGEFSHLNATEARERLTAGKKELSDLSDTPLVTFIPPQNEISTEASSVLFEFGITYLSDKGTSMYDYDASTWDGSTAKDAISDCNEVFANGENLCVIMLHPQDFSTADMKIDYDRYTEYTKLLNTLENIDVSVIRFNEITIDMLKENTV